VVFLLAIANSSVFYHCPTTATKRVFFQADADRRFPKEKNNNTIKKYWM